MSGKSNIAKTNTLKVRDDRGLLFKFTIHPWEGGGAVLPWKKFFKWYFSSKKPHYMLEHNSGITMITRDHIEYFSVKVGGCDERK